MKRNTPTCVGKTKSGRILLKWLQKHPHVRGEDLLIDTGTSTIGGNTPTCVGKTGTTAIAARFRWKHPHVRGEDEVCIIQLDAALETPPRAWGRHSQHSAGIPPPGNTPTCVGKTLLESGHRTALWKHPHVRGEDATVHTTAAIGHETPPRAWGRLLHDHDRGYVSGNTPTCVGKTGWLDRRSRSG